MTAPRDPATLGPVVHLGVIARELREGHMSRSAFAEAVGLAVTDYRNWEAGRRVLSTPQLQRILRHPIMKTLAGRAAAAGIEPTPPAPRDQGDGSEPGNGGTEL